MFMMIYPWVFGSLYGVWGYFSFGRKKEEGGINGIDRVWGKRRRERKESKSIIDVYLVTSQY